MIVMLQLVIVTPSSLGGACGDDRDGSRDDVSTNWRGRVEGDGENGVGEKQE